MQANDCAITKEEFIEYIQSLRTVYDFQRGVLDLLQKHDPYADLGIMQYPDCTNELLTLLEKIMHDTDGWISYYCYEIDFGREWKRGMCWADDGTTEIPLQTIEDLWNALIK